MSDFKMTYVMNTPLGSFNFYFDVSKRIWLFDKGVDKSGNSLPCPYCNLEFMDYVIKDELREIPNGPIDYLDGKFPEIQGLKGH